MARSSRSVDLTGAKFGLLLQGFIFIFICCLVGKLSIFDDYQNWNYMRENGIATSAVIIQTDAWPKHGRGIRYQFEVENAGHTEFVSSWYHTDVIYTCMFKVGDRITIWYLPQDPHVSRISGYMGFLFLPALFLVIMLPILLLAVLRTAYRTHRARRMLS